MAQRPHASSVNRGKPKSKTGSGGQKTNLLYWRFWSGRLALFSTTSLTVGSARETNGRQTRSLKEKSEKREVMIFGEMVTQLRMRLDY